MTTIESNPHVALNNARAEAYRKGAGEVDKLAQMLYETIHVLEMHNFMELLPVDALAWYENRRANESNAGERDKAEALKFLERRVEHWQRIATAE